MQELLRAACGAAFLAAGYVSVAAIIYTVVEMIAIASFAPFAFATGKTLIRTKEPFIIRPAALPPKGATPHASFRLITPERCLFRESGPDLFLFRIAGPFFLKGTIDVGAGQAVTVGRLSLGPSVLYMAFLAAWTAGALGVLLQDGWPALGGVMLFLLGGWSLLALLAIVSIGFAKRRFRRACDEILAALRPTIVL